MDKLDNYELLDLNYAVEKIYREITESLTTVDSPKGYILVGQPGAGKTTLQRMIFENDSNIAIINGDEYRKRHPHYEEIFEKYGKDAVEHTQSFSNAVTNTLIAKLSEDGYNIVVEGTGRRAEVPLKTCRDLKEKGYDVELMVMCCNAEIAWQSTIDRYNMLLDRGEQPRAVPRDKFEEAVNALPYTVSTLFESGEFSEITLYNRKKDCLYRMSEKEYDPALDVYDILHQYGHEYIADDYAYSFVVNENHLNIKHIDSSLSIEKAVEVFEKKYNDFEFKDEYSMLTLSVEYIKADGTAVDDIDSEIDLLIYDEKGLRVIEDFDIEATKKYKPDFVNDTYLFGKYLPQIREFAEKLNDKTLDLTQGQGNGRK